MLGITDVGISKGREGAIGINFCNIGIIALPNEEITYTYKYTSLVSISDALRL